jgi:uncharacterized protein YyaL (SSP411 family)
MCNGLVEEPAVPPDERSYMETLMQYSKSRAGSLAEGELRMDEKYERTNRLIDERSPYLLQHAHNPVDWYPWGDEAFEQAVEDDKPIFLSIGYATCHWCHVMERESFSDNSVAALLNENFISIKVDREERPDIDQIYMTASQLLSGTGGWPLSVFLTPDKKPFFATTYIPKESTYERIGLLDILPRISAMWQEEREKLLSAADEVERRLNTPPQKSRTKRPGKNLPVQCYEDLVLQYDYLNGGFGGAPKFPLHSHILFLHRYWKWAESEKALRMAQKTLDMMARGGIYDHLGFGFHRYSTDGRWLVPHFEKMLYDQALAVLSYSEAYQITGSDTYLEVARDCLAYVEREMTSPEGGFYSAQDADSEGEEGRYYLWTKDEIEELLNPEENRILSHLSRISTQGNFIDPALGERSGKNIIHIAISPHDAAKTLGVSQDRVQEIFESARNKLFAARRERIAPRTDDKILADWNGLMIAAYAFAGRTFGRADYLANAESAAQFILHNLKDANDSLLHRYRDGEAGIAGMAADYAFMAWGLLELYASSFKAEYLEHAIDLSNHLETNFRDKRSGGYYTADTGSVDLIARQMDLHDGALPSVNSVVYSNLLRLYMLSGDTSFQQRAHKLSGLYAGAAGRSPASYTYFCSGFLLEIGPSSQVVIVGDAGSKDTREFIDPLQTAFLPFCATLLRDPRGDPALDRIAGYSSSYGQMEGKATAYVCRGHTCSRPTADPEEMSSLLGIPEKKK